ncbi:hypothetical protein OG884_21345 [Streptosporangium sp. NBC_01755]|uniref:hypothetical protein n=1 Tax=unclassified Streptosporangium TaxID=2632669 RepID=UPI002DD8A0F3|nr:MULTISPECIES: hypothetical protein [unclassified Streptosporangium]WSA24488.1 hypothetical protein OIE13_26580 [Streptosporangium sp. NBC_01810]WSC97438.1 hypothetical protein OG884_21345 [Streptosporangium sp. NBC_01755]
MRVHAARKRSGKSKTATAPKPRTPLPEHVVPAAPRHMPMPPMPMRPTRQPRRIPGKGGR